MQPSSCTLASSTLFNISSETDTSRVLNYASPKSTFQDGVNTEICCLAKFLKKGNFECFRKGLILILVWK
jgi:hypothetical protein